ncbi:MAG: response regulator transcription factor [Actinomycetota bacterium]
MENTKALIVEDDPDVREALKRALAFEGYDVATANDGGRGLEAVIQDPPDIIVLDVMMPFVDGLEMCRRLRAKGISTPVLMLTALGQVSDRVDGLDAGADDYLIKPFALDELLARIRALLRRSSGDVSEALAFADIEMNLAAREVTRSGDLIDLTKTEFDLLEVLLRSSGRVATRDQIYRDVWGFDFETSSNSLDVYVGYLRRKTEVGDRSRLIHTVRGVGYVLRDEA